MRADRLQTLMNQRGLDDGQLAAYTGVSKSMVFYLRKGERENVSAVILAKLANKLMTSVDYLVGLTDDPSPRTMNINERLLDLIQVAKELRMERVDDLIDMARVYRDKQKDDIQAMNAVLERIRELGGDEIADEMIDLFNRLRGGPSATPGVDTGGLEH